MAALWVFVLGMLYINLGMVLAIFAGAGIIREFNADVIDAFTGNAEVKFVNVLFWCLIATSSITLFALGIKNVLA